MKKLFTLTAIFAIPFISFSQTRTSIADGNATNPFIWDCTCIPSPGNDIVINHDVVLDSDFGYTSGSITVNAGASLTGNSATRVLGVGGGTFNNYGNFSIADFYQSGGTTTNTGTMIIQSNFVLDLTATASNSGTFTVDDSLLVNTNASLTNSGTVDAYVAGIAGTLTNTASFSGFVLGNSGMINHNSGSLVFTDIFNSGTITAAGNITASNDVWNSENMTISGLMDIGHSLYTGDSINLNASFVNNGLISIAFDLLNSDDIDGSGRFCVGQSTANSGAITGTLDICDLTGGAIDFNSGTVAGTVTYCAVSCNLSLEETRVETAIEMYPNPFNNEINIRLDKEGIYKVYVVNTLGALVLETTVNGRSTVLDAGSLPDGVYFYKVMKEDSALVSTGKLVKQ